MSLSIEAEWLSMEICRAFGLSTAETEMISFQDQKVLSVTRFDRKWIGRSLLRLPQEDFCQMLGLPSTRKYEADGGPGIARILDVLNESDRRHEDRRHFMKSQIVFWLLASIDGHAKNFSVLSTPTGFGLSPLYDVMSIDPFISAKHFPRQKLKLAMSVGQARHYKVQEIQRKHWQQSAAKARLSLADIESVLSELAAQVTEVIHQVEKKIPQNFPDVVASKILQGLRQRANTL